jgi:hypothetical protein
LAALRAIFDLIGLMRRVYPLPLPLHQPRAGRPR